MKPHPAQAICVPFYIELIERDNLESNTQPDQKMLEQVRDMVNKMDMKSRLVVPFYATRFIYKFLLPVRLIAEAVVAAGKIIYAVWQVVTGDISLLEGLKAIGSAVFDFLVTPFAWARDVVLGIWNVVSGIFTSIASLVTNAAMTIGHAPGN